MVESAKQGSPTAFFFLTHQIRGHHWPVFKQSIKTNVQV